MKTIFVTIGMFLSLTACSSTNDDNLNHEVMSKKEKAVAVLNCIETGDQTAIGYINAENYTQHNLGVADGLAGFGAVLQQLPEGSAKVDVVRAFEDGDFVFTHTEYNFFGPKVGFDIFRFEEGKIVEHWDNLAEITEPNPSGRTQFDGAVQVENLAKTEVNKELVKDFVTTILVEGKMDQLGNYFDGDNYIQHNSGIADGLSGLGKALEELGKMGISMVYNKIHMVLGEGNFVLVVSEGSLGDKHTAYYDLFRVENGKIAEHWDVLETILPESDWKNDNGKF